MSAKKVDGEDEIVNTEETIEVEEVIDEREVVSSSPSLDGIIHGLAPLSRTFGYDANTIRKWIGQGLPYLTKAENKSGKWSFSITEVHRWIVAREVEKVTSDLGRSTGDNEELLEWELRKKKADALIAEHRLAEERGVLIRMDDAVRERELADAEVRAALNDLPGRYAADLALESSDEGCLKILRDAVDAALNKLVLLFDDAENPFVDEEGNERDRDDG